MTRHDRSNLSLLEQDLADLALPSPDDARFRRELRADLAGRTGQVELPRRRRPRLALRRRPAAVAAAALAIAAAFAVVLVGTRETGGPGVAAAAVIAHARLALAPPPNRILHEKVVSEVHGGVMAGGGYSESWQLTSQPYSARWIGTFAGGPETANDGTTEYLYDGKHTIYTRPSSAPLQLSSTLAQLRENLDSGRAHVVGETTIEGASVYEISLPYGYIGYFDTRTYRPLFLDSPTSGPSAASGRKIRMRVVTMEYLHPTPANLRLLSLTAQHPGASVEEDPGAWGGK
jgi:hypothetical protein